MTRRKRLTEEERDQRLKARIKDAKLYISIYGFFVQYDQFGEKVDGNNRDLVTFFRAIIDRALLDVLLSNPGDEDRDNSIEWFCTSAFDQVCQNAGIEPSSTLQAMQNVFDHYKESKYGQNWEKPNLLNRVSVT